MLCSSWIAVSEDGGGGHPKTALDARSSPAPGRAASAVPLLAHETAIKYDADVLGDCWAAHLKISRNRVDGAVSLDEEIEHPATRGMANCPKDIWLRIWSHHQVANVRKQVLTPRTSRDYAARPARSTCGVTTSVARLRPRYQTCYENRQMMLT
jgi:hypothetical protein